ncbi:hypothetical protein A33K_14360 [Burkholderia humptydooensis MSMB43]|uniref:Transposase n=1 Tax=Burkholderia humptydooensis MSMB43 TaxID=441157 RepID=A0ABN0G7Z4_9BURK|nr:hypothetical protein A33K_14360 [Burkholderia humptydooensis MSMB43]
MQELDAANLDAGLALARRCGRSGPPGRLKKFNGRIAFRVLKTMRPHSFRVQSRIWRGQAGSHPPMPQRTRISGD